MSASGAGKTYGCCGGTTSAQSPCGCCAGVVPITPVTLWNPPGLSAIKYRVGTYGQFRETMISALSSYPTLLGLTTRADDDLTIGLLDSFAAVGDVLSFYQERIANEGFLRTATERLSLLQLAREIGYELGPGVAASTHLAFTIDTSGSVTSTLIDIGTKVQSIPLQGKTPPELPQVFETIEKIEARPEWNSLRPKLTAPQRVDRSAIDSLREVHFKGTGLRLHPGDGLLFVARDTSQAFAFRTISSIQELVASQQTIVQLVVDPSADLNPFPPPFSTDYDNNSSAISYTEQGVSKVRVFVTGIDGHLYSSYLGSEWRWLDHGAPFGNSITSGPAAAVYQQAIAPSKASQELYSFAIGEDGHLYATNWDGATARWRWNDLGVPPGVTLTNVPSAVAYDAAFVSPPSLMLSCFALGDDGNLHVKNWGSDGSGGFAWSGWDYGVTNLGPPAPGVSVSGGPSAVAARQPSGDAFVCAFVMGSDGGLYVYYRNVNQPYPWAWSNLNSKKPGGLKLIGSGAHNNGPRAVLVPGTSPSVVCLFSVSNDGHLWSILWNGAVSLGGIAKSDDWSWSDLGTPPGTTVAAIGPGVLASQDTAGKPVYRIFIRGADGHLYMNYLDTTESYWEDHGTPSSSSSVMSGAGVVTYSAEDGTQIINSFIVGSDCHLYSNYWDGSSWNWLDQNSLYNPPSNVASSTGSVSGGPGGAVEKNLAEIDSSELMTIISQPMSNAELASFVVEQGWSLDDFISVVNALASELAPPPTTDVLVFRAKAGFFGASAQNYGALAPPVGTQFPKFPINWDDPTSPLAINEDSQGKEYDDGATVYLDSVRPTVEPGSWVAFRSQQGVRAFTVGNTKERSMADFLLSSRVTGLILNASDGELFPFKLRETTAYLQSEPLTLSDLQDETDVSGTTVTLNQAVGGLQVDGPLAITGELAAQPGVTANEVVRLDDITHFVGAAPLTTLTFEPLLNTYKRDTVFINANVALATHGETKNEVMGSGDPTQPYLEFALKQKPLTFVRPIPPASAASGYETTLQVWVDGIRWNETPSLYELAPDSRSYITRRDDDGTVNVIFGNAHPTVGVENITAQYRVGTGLSGMVKAGQLSLPVSRPLGVRSVTNPLQADGASDPEDREHAREHAPITVLTLDRIVSLTDVQNFALAFAGIAKALALWSWVGDRKVVSLIVASSTGQAVVSGSSLYSSLSQAIADFKDPSLEIMIDESFQELLFDIHGWVLVGSDRDPNKVGQAVTLALQQAFSFEARELGQPVHLSDVLGVIQAVDGVVAAEIDKLYVPGQLGQSGLSNDVLTCGFNQLLMINPDPDGIALDMRVSS